MGTCDEKQNKLIGLFQPLSAEERYQKIIQLGKELSPLSSEHKTEENLVKGCQSQVFLYSEKKEGKIYFTASSEALISAGLAALLILVYNGETPESILTCKPFFIKELNLSTSLSPGRSNGLSSMHLRMQQDALKYLLN